MVSLAGGPGSDDRLIGFGDAAGIAFGGWLDAGKRVDGGSLAEPEGVDLVVGGPDRSAADRVTDIAGASATALAITWFGVDGPYADWRGSDEVIHSLAGVAYGFGNREGPPTLPQGHMPQLAAGVQAFNTGLAALSLPGEQRPRRVDVNVFESFLCVSEVAAIAGMTDERSRGTRLGVNRFSPTYPCTSYRASDGWVGVTCLTPAQWYALCDVLGDADLAAEPAYRTSFRRLLRADDVDAVVAPRFAERTVDEWVAFGLSHRIPITAMPRPQELPAVEHWRARGAFTAVGGTADVVAPSFPAKFEFAGAPSERRAHAVRPDRAGAPRGPLTGTRVIDFTMGWAGPQATRFLADLGADVIKIESEGHPDWYRGWEADQGGDPPPIELKTNFNALNRNKRGIVLDLDHEPGRDAALALIATADVVIENFAHGVMDKLGLGPDAQRAANPDVISVAMPAFGRTGTWAGIRAYGSTVEQASGLPFVNGEAAWDPCLQHVAVGDPIAGLYAASVVLVALAARDRLGRASIDLAQVPCLFEMGADAIIAAQLGGLERTGSRRRRAVPCCVVAAAGDDEWLTVVVDTDDAWHGLASVIGALPDIATRDAREKRADEIESAIADWAASRPGEDAASALRAAGVIAARVQRVDELGTDPQLAASGYWERMHRPYAGDHYLGAPAFRFDGARPAAVAPAPTLGQHTREVLAELRLES